MDFWNSLAQSSREQIVITIIILIIGGFLTKLGEVVFWPVLLKLSRNAEKFLYPIIVQIPLLRQIALKKYYSALERKASRLSNPWLPEEQKKLEERYVPVKLVKNDLLPGQVHAPDIELGTNMYIEDAIQKFHKLVIVGEPGIGKTTALQYVALDIIKNRLTRIPLKVVFWRRIVEVFFKLPTKNESLIPIWIELKRFAAQEKPLSEYIYEILTNEFSFPNAKNYLNHLVKKGRVSFLFDALDKVGE